MCVRAKHRYREANYTRSVIDGDNTASEDNKAKEKESNKVRKKRCIQREFSGDRYD